MFPFADPLNVSLSPSIGQSGRERDIATDEDEDTADEANQFEAMAASEPGQHRDQLPLDRAR